MAVDVIIDPLTGQIYWNDSQNTAQSIAISGNGTDLIKLIGYSLQFTAAPVGTITAANNTTTITGTNTNFTTLFGSGASANGAILYTVQGTSIGIISSVTNDTTLVLQSNATGNYNNINFKIAPPAGTERIIFSDSSTPLYPATTGAGLGNATYRWSFFASDINASGNVIFSNPLSVLYGGTGTSSITANSLLLGNGTSAITGISGSAAQFLIANSSNIPSFVTLSGDITSTASGVITIGANAVSTTKILDGSIITSKILDSNVTEAKLATDSVSTSKILANSVTTAKILDSNVTEAKLATDSVSTSKILANSVTTVKILDSNVTEAKLATDSVSTSKILANSVTTVKILDSNVTEAKLATDSVSTSKILANSVITVKILDSNVTEAKLATDSVSTSKILANSVTSVKILDGNVTEAKLATDSVSTSKILANSVTTAKILDSNVTEAKLATDSVSTSKILANSVTTAKIFDANVTFAKIENASANSVLGRSTNSAGVHASISATLDGSVLRLSGTTLGFGAINLSSANAVSGILPVASGGLGTSNVSLVNNGVLIYSTTNTRVQTITPAANQVLVADPSGVPQFSSDLHSTVTIAGGKTIYRADGTDVAIADGGTGASTATSAINNLLPSQSTNGGKYLTTDGSNVSWATVSAGGGSGTISTGTINVLAYYSGANTTASATGLVYAASGDHLIITSQGAAITPLRLVAASGQSANLFEVANVTDKFVIDNSGNVSTGTWQGSIIGRAYGGTGTSATPGNGQLLIGNGSAYTVANLTEGGGVGVTNSSGSITLRSKRVVNIVLASGLNPTLGADTAIVRIPESPSDGTTSLTYNIRRLQCRVETPSSGTTTFQVQYSASTTAFSGSNLLTSAMSVTGTSSYEFSMTSASFSPNTLSSGTKLRLNFSAVDSTHAYFSINLLLEES